jgi:hypothetical protein
MDGVGPCDGVQRPQAQQPSSKFLVANKIITVAFSGTIVAFVIYSFFSLTLFEQAKDNILNVPLFDLAEKLAQCRQYH